MENDDINPGELEHDSPGENENAESPAAGEELPGDVTRLEVEGKTVYILGTAHVSRKSVEDVRAAAEAIRPDVVAVELCEPRYRAMRDPDAWKNMNILKVIREKKAVFLLAQLILSSFYRKIGEELGVKPGEEMLEGVKQAERLGAELVLADRKVDVTLRRVWGALGIWKKFKLMAHILGALFMGEKIDEKTVEEIKQKDQLEAVLETFGESFPEIKGRLIDERDAYLAEKIRRSSGSPVLAVVGAGHVAGIVENIESERDLSDLETTPPKSRWPSVVKWLIPLLILGLVIYGFFSGGPERSIEAVYIWVAVNAVFSAVGAALALAHPLTVLSAFVAAPITSLNPMIAAGWVCGLVQAKVRQPAVKDLEDLPSALTSVKGFWLNPVTRILLVVVLANLGSSVGTFVSGSWIAVHVL
jgi:pheromone shutdown-related protein TraB